MTDWPNPQVPPPNWPTTIDEKYKVEPLSGLLKAWYQAQLDELRESNKALQDQDWQAEKASIDAEIALSKAIHDARVEVAKGAIQRGQSGAEFVRNAAAAIVTLYTGLLGLLFGKEAFAEKPAALVFPDRGIIPALFLGFALGAAAFYVAYLTRSPSVRGPLPSSSYRVFAERRLNVFVDWSAQLALNRVYWLHAAVIALSFGVLFLPIAFMDLPERVAWGWAAIAGVVTLVIPFLTGPAESLPSDSL